MSFLEEEKSVLCAGSGEIVCLFRTGCSFLSVNPVDFFFGVGRGLLRFPVAAQEWERFLP